MIEPQSPGLWYTVCAEPEVLTLNYRLNTSHPLSNQILLCIGVCLFPSVFSLTYVSPHKLIGAAFVDYARLLRTLGLRESAAFWASRAGGAGEQLLEELFQGEGAVPEETEGLENTE